jgi:hypothetical protein
MYIRLPLNLGDFTWFPTIRFNESGSITRQLTYLLRRDQI